MDVTVREERGCLVAAVEGRLDSVNAAEFEQKIGGLIHGEPRNIVLDLSGLKFIGSAGLRSILTISRVTKEAGGALALCGLAGLPREIFQLSHFDTIFTLHAGVEDAVKNF